MTNQKSNALQEKLKNSGQPPIAVSPEKNLESLLDTYGPIIQKALPSVIGKDKKQAMERLSFLMMSEVKKNPQLLQCTPYSIIAGLIQSTRLGLEIGGELAHCYLIPFKNKKSNTMEAQFIVGYKGYIELFYRSGLITSIHADIVKEADDFSFEYGTNEHLYHKPNWGTSDKGRTLGAYAYAKMKSGGIKFVEMDMSELLMKKSRFSKSQYGPWETDTEAMFKKSCIRELQKFLPKNAEAEKAISVDENTVPRLDLETEIPELQVPMIEPLPEEPKQQEGI